MAEIEFLDRVKRLVIVAMFADDYLMERLVLKGGNLLDIVFGVSARASVDVDFSIEGEFDDLDLLQRRIERTLTRTFKEHGYVAFDVRVEEKPDQLTEDLKPFWGGYGASFKIIDQESFRRLGGDVETLRRNAAVIGRHQSTKFSVQISKFEYCRAKISRELDGYAIFVYPPELLVCEKLRAICQQMPEYRKIVRNHPSARARDFVDAYVIADHFRLGFSEPEFQGHLRAVFAAKRVPLQLIGEIEKQREFHRADFRSVEDTVRPGFKLKKFDFYFDWLVSSCRCLKPLWDE